MARISGARERAVAIAVTAILVATSAGGSPPPLRAVEPAPTPAAEPTVPPPPSPSPAPTAPPTAPPAAAARPPTATTPPGG